MIITAAFSSDTRIDAAEVKRALGVLVDPEHGVHFTAPPWGKDFQVNLKGDDLGKAVDEVQRIAGGMGIFMCLNPTPVGHTGRSNASVVLSRRWLFVDVDPVKTVEFCDDPASDAEKASAREVAEEVLDWLGEVGFPAPVVVDSGNGWYLLYRIDLPNDAHAGALVKTVIYALASKFSGDRGKIDKGIHNADRIARVPGTENRKGKASEDRPYRKVRLLHVPTGLEIVSAELLAAAVAAAKSKEVPPLERNGHVNGVIDKAGPIARSTVIKVLAGGAHAYGDAALKREIARVSMAVPGSLGGEGRNNVLFKAAANLGELIEPCGLNRQEVEAQLDMAAVLAGLGDDPNCGPHGIRATIVSGLNTGEKHPRVIPEKKGTAQAAKQKAAESPAAAAVAAGELIIVRASEITPRKVEWLWPGRIPLGKLTTFAGVGGLGKTFVLCDITARVTRGLPWPDSLDGECPEPGQVLFVSGEDDADDTLVPRLIELNADLEKVAFLKTEVQDRFTLADLGTLDKAVQQIGPRVRFVAIDPPTAYLGGVDDHKNSELRSLLGPLKNWSAKHSIAIVFNTHVTKPQGAKVEAMMRVMGSVAWVNAVRAAHIFARDPEDHERRLFVGMKLNIGKEKKGLAYKIVSTTDDLARVEWLGEVDTTADEAVNKERRKKRNVVAADWLEKLFATVDEMPSKVIWDAKKADTSLSDDALKEAKDDMGIIARQRCDPDGERCWWWIWTGEAKRHWNTKKQDRKREAEADADTEGM